MTTGTSHTLPIEHWADAVYATVVYCNMFDFAPSLIDVQKWLLRPRQFSAMPRLSEIQQLLDADPRLTHVDGVYVLHGRKGLAQQRNEKYNFTETKWQYAKPLLRLLSVMPFVRGVWLCNSMGWNNARRLSDIDIVIIAKAGHIWTARLFTAGIMKLLKQRPGEQHPAKAICLSMYIADNHLNLEDSRHADGDIHFDFWCTQFYPVLDRDALYERFRSENTWLAHTFADLQWTLPVSHRTLSWKPWHRGIQTTLERLTSPFEHTFKKVQQRIMPDVLKRLAGQDSRVRLEDSVLKFHTHDTRREIHQAFLEALR